MKNIRHCLLLIIVSVIAVSVFLSSCGIPSFCTLSRIKITAAKKYLGFDVNGSDSDLSLVEEGPGCVLMYIQSDDSTTTPYMTSTTGLIKQFDTLASNKLYINTDSSILTFKSTDDSKEYTLSAFNNYNNSVLSNPSSPAYNLNLKQFVSSTTIKQSFKLSNIRWNEESVLFDICNTDDDNPVVYNTIGAKLNDSSKKYFHVFASFSAEVGNFSNNYWSSLVYIGTIEKE